MASLNISINTEIDDAVFKQYIETLTPFIFQAEPSGMHLYRLAQDVSQGNPIRIVETGCLRDTNPSAAFSDGWSTYYLAKFAKKSGSQFVSVELFRDGIETCRDFLFTYELDESVNFVLEDSIVALNTNPNLAADFYFLDSCDGLEHGLAEFKAALAHKPKMIVMDDYDTKCQLAAEFAKEKEIKVQRVDRYTVFDLRNSAW